MKLQDVLAAYSDENLEDAQRLRKLRFWEAISGSPLNRWKVGQIFSDVPLRLLIGLAPSYSRSDIELADQLIEGVRGRDNVRIDLFDMTDLDGMSDLEQYIPGMKTAYHTPVVGVWVRGELQEYAEGASGRKLVMNLLQP